MDIQNLQIVLEFDLSKLFSDLKTVNAALDGLQARIESIPDVNVGADFNMSEESEQRFLRRLDSIEQRGRMNVPGRVDLQNDASATFLAKLEALEKQAGIDVDADMDMSNHARAHLFRQLRQIERQTDLDITPTTQLRASDLQSAWDSNKKSTRTNLYPTVRLPSGELRKSWEKDTDGFDPDIGAGLSLNRGDLSKITQEAERHTADLNTEFDYERSLAALSGQQRRLEQSHVTIPVDFETRSESLTRVLSQRQSLARNAVKIPVEFDLREGTKEKLSGMRESNEKNAVDIPVHLKLSPKNIDSIATMRQIQESNAVNIPVNFKINSESLAKLSAVRSAEERMGLNIPVNFTADSDFSEALLKGDIDADKLDISLDNKTMKKMADGGGRADRGGMKQARSAKRRAPDHGLLTSRAGGKDGDSFLDAFNLRAADIHNMRAKLLPALWTFIGALPAAVAGLASLTTAALGAAAGLAGIAGLGLLGAASARSGGGKPTGEAISEIFSEIANDAWEAFEPLASRLAPLFERGLDAMDVFFMRLAGGFEVLTDFAPMAIDFGRWAMKALPMIINNLISIAIAFRDVFSAINDGLDGQAIFDRMAQTFADMLPYLAQIVSTVWAALPAITNLSIGFMRVTSVVFALLKPLIDLMNRFPVLAQMFGMTMAAAMLLTSVLAVLNTRVVMLAIKAIPTLGAALIGMYSNMIAGAGASTLLSGGLSGIASSALAAVGGVTALKAAVVGFLAISGIGLLVMAVGWLASKWINTKTNIEGATDALKDFENQQKGMSGDGPQPYGAPQPPKKSNGGNGPTRLGPEGGATTTHLHGGRGDHEDLDRVADKNNFVQRRTAGQ